LHEFLHREFLLPEAWPFTDYGSFSSGGLSLGNVVFEIEQDPDASQGEALYAFLKGIAFEPVGRAEPTLAWLDQMAIGHTAPEPYTMTIEGSEEVLWVTFGLEVPPTTARIFVCDYTDRKSIREGQETGSRELNRTHGGPLGIQGLGEIIISLPNISEGTEEWVNLLGRERMVSEGLFRFSEGPSIRIEQSELEGIREIVLEVASLADAKTFLDSKGFLGQMGEGFLTIAPSAIQGLRIRLREGNPRGQ